MWKIMKVVVVQDLIEPNEDVKKVWNLAHLTKFIDTVKKT